MDHASLAELKDIRKQHEHTNRILMQFYLRTQLQEADKVPDIFKAGYINLSSPTPVALTSKSNVRHEISVSNGGPGTLALMDQPYDPSVFANYTNTGNILIPVIILPSGGTLTFKLAAALWGACVTSGSSCAVNIVETLFAGLPHAQYYEHNVSQTEKTPEFD